MEILVLGGTGFVGRHIVAAALAGGHHVTLFNRGSERDVFPDVARRIGDRDGGLAALDGGSWDVAIDVTGYVPRLVRDAATALRGRVGRFAFVSTVSVYADRTRASTTEDAPLAEIDDPATERVDAATYGPLKVACEREVTRLFGGDALLLRPGVVVGPHDPTDRFTYWVRRVAAGGEVLAPHAPDTPTQWIDGRDLADFTLLAVERGLAGPYNLVQEPGSVTFGALLTTIADVGGKVGTFTWVDGDFLVDRGVRPSADLPLWIHGEASGLLRVDPARARSEGLRARPLRQTVQDTLAWDRSRPNEPLRVGLTAERERALLDAWRDRSR
jgi:2'-hydroxyisoflavone reductase